MDNELKAKLPASAIKWRILKSLICPIDERQSYRAGIIADHEYRFRTHRDRFEFSFSDDAGESWKQLPVQLCWKSALHNALHGTWPPETMDKLYQQGKYIVLEYRDPWIFFERPFMPFGWDRESLWHAYFDPAKENWRLVRVKKLDYDGDDAPPV